MQDVDVSPLVDAIRQKGFHHIPIDCSLDFVNRLRMFDKNSCYIAYGEIDFVRQISRGTQLIPGAYCNFENMRCSTYYGYFGKYLLNSQYLMIPLGELPRFLKEMNYEGCEDRFFVRPDIGTKPFTGFVVCHDSMNMVKHMIKSYGRELLIVVSPEKKIDKEFRFVVCDQKVVTGCQYLPKETPLFSPHAYRLAQEIAGNSWFPDRCYTIDIAESNDTCSLLEINSFSCAGLYDCNMDLIVENVSRIALQGWREYQSMIGDS